ncbi:MAG: hypothetical protein WCH43_04250 [Verrucomicrobiota bacterium]
MKFNAEEIKKLILSLMMFMILLYCYKNFLLDDLNKRETNANSTIASLSPELKKAQDQITRTAGLKDKAPADNEVLDQIKALIPAGEPVAWFPPHITEFFKRQGIEKSFVKQGGAVSGKDLPGFKKIGWSIELPRTEFVQLAIAIAGLENEEPLLEINSLLIDESADNLQFQHASLNVTTIIKDDKR